jgi:hypothetical protein
MKVEADLAISLERSRDSVQLAAFIVTAALRG